MRKFIEATVASSGDDALVAIRYIISIREAPEIREPAVSIFTVDGSKYYVVGTLEDIGKVINEESN